MLFPKKLIILDLETTGFSAFDNEIIEVGLVVLDKDMNEIGSFGTLVKPFNNGELFDKLPDKIVEITGITDDMIDKYGMDELTVKSYLQELCKDSFMIYHNAEFDSQFLKQWNIDSELFYDTLSMSRGLNKGFTSHKLGDVTEQYGIELEDAHRAVNDARATSELFKAMINKFDKEHDVRKNYVNTLVPNKKYGIKYKPATKTRIKEGV